jgi:hypothetical protein
MGKDKPNNEMSSIPYTWMIIENIAVMILAGFCVYYTKSLWGLIVLAFINFIKIKRTDIDKEDDENG